jgi:hypothetical protein
LAEASDFTDFLEEKYLPRSISINADTSRVVATIFFAGETVTKDFTNLLPRLEGREKLVGYRLHEGWYEGVVVGVYNKVGHEQTRRSGWRDGHTLGLR